MSGSVPALVISPRAGCLLKRAFEKIAHVLRMSEAGSKGYLVERHIRFSKQLLRSDQPDSIDFFIRRMIEDCSKLALQGAA